MARSFQVTFDSDDPHALGAWWADVLDYDVEDHTHRVQDLRDTGVLGADEVVAIGERLGFADADADAEACRDPDGVGARLLFQRVPEPKSAKNRVHLDLHVGDAELDATSERFAVAGATLIGERSHPGSRWIVLEDPEGNEFCLL